MPLPVLPRKRFGQNFLSDKKTLGKMCEAARLDGSDEVVEVGPGGGTLTRFILEKSAKVWAVEKDARLAGIFPGEIVSDKKFTLVEGDILKVGFERFYSGRPMKMVSNLPYGISSGVLKMLTEQRRFFSLAVIMLQKEVASRVTAPSGTRESGSLSAVIQMVFDAEKLFDVSPALFNPRPRVTSSVVRLVPLQSTRFPLKSEQFYCKTVRAAFSGRRKMIRNSLLSMFSRGQVETALEKAAVDGRRRAESLELKEFSVISDRLLEAVSTEPAAPSA